jgi:hypothetical protein
MLAELRMLHSFKLLIVSATSATVCVHCVTNTHFGIRQGHS